MARPLSRPDPLDDVFKALAHAGRRALLEALATRDGRTLAELVAVLPTTRQAVSQHLAVLEKAGLVVTRRSGREKLHYLNPTPLADAFDRVAVPLLTHEARALLLLREAIEAGVRKVAEGRAG